MSRLKRLLDFHREDPRDCFVRFALASEYQKLGQLEEAVGIFEDLRTTDPRYVGTYYHLGKLYERIGRQEDAVQVYRDGILVAMELTDFHSRAELQSALLEAQGMNAE